MNPQLVTKFAKRDELKDELFPHLQLGDLVEFKRLLLSHFAVYVGSIADIHCVIDFVWPDDANLVDLFCRAQLEAIAGPVGSAHVLLQSAEVAGVVRFVPIESILGDDETRINNSFDGNPHPPLEGHAIVKCAAEQFHAAERDYHLFRSNCEHFATLCRYGVAFSSQTDTK